MMIEINKAKNAIELEELSRARKALSFVKRANEKLQQSDASTKPQAMQSAPIVQRPAANEAGVRHSALPLFANAVIARCRELLLMEKPKCAATLKDYRAKFQLFEGRLQPPDGASEGDRWARPLLAYSGTRRSYRLNRAAVLWGLRQKISANLDRLESALAGGCSREVSWRHDISMLKALAETHDALGSIAYQPKTSEGVEKVGSKRRDLRIIRKAVPNWASVMEEAMARRKYLDATTTLRLAGVRPEDLVVASKSRSVLTMR